MKFSDKEIASYYDQTQNHYERWWKLNDSQSVHYGLWGHDTKSFVEALKNTNQVMAEIGSIFSGSKILDAGSGVGGAAFYLAEKLDCDVTGITLSDKQLKTANQVLASLGVESKVRFEKQSFMQTGFEDNSFDVVWACESSCYAIPKTGFYDEVYRILKPGGKLIVADYFLTKKGELDKNRNVKNWGDLWAISDFYKAASFEKLIERSGFKINSKKDYTKEITKSSRWMYYASILAAPVSFIYGSLIKTSRFAKHHYRSGIFQYRALKNQEWQYWITCLEKPINNPSED